MINFPGSLDDTVSLPDPGSGNFTDNPSHAGVHDLENAAIRAIEAKIGIGASTPITGRVFRGTGTGTSAWAQLVLTTDVTGILPVANGGTSLSSLATGVVTFLGTPSSANLLAVVTDETGTGLLVFNSSPTIVTPTIASFTNAQHNHQNAAGGGQLTGSSAISAGSINFANLLSTIFSGQVATQANAGTAGGNMWWVNLGGIKIMWGFAASVSSSTTDTNYGFTLPAFFSTINTVICSPATLATDGRQYANVNSFSTSVILITVVSAAPASQRPGFIAIGT